MRLEDDEIRLREKETILMKDEMIDERFNEPRELTMLIELNNMNKFKIFIILNR